MAYEQSGVVTTRRKGEDWCERQSLNNTNKKPQLDYWPQAQRERGGTPGNSWWGCAPRFSKS